ncbi:alkaline phosphatase D family protein [Pseudoduganella dura]|uniref:alkaline phosphatase D family protein n=1 Tax=Pseudoduganella dura TaxID=321982 RepID=UPI0015668552|nr:alkaline phosphatase D family protein [Pseudoduganella dura]GGX89939.1 hypothetical protein GCM10007386_21040 [Pseudoduganella dura]
MNIAFTSCIDAVDDHEQEVWTTIAQHAPDVLVLLGDIMYMDYGLGFLGSQRPVGWPRKVTNDVFATTMHERYARQWSVASFRALLATGIPLGMTWDDHDFAWNNSRGRGRQKYFAVSRDKRLIAQGLFRQFRGACNDIGLSAYPAMPSLTELLEGPEEGIQARFDHEDVRFIMIDGRSFREDPRIRPDADMLGQPQREWIRQELSGWHGMVVIGSGSVLTGTGESWAEYSDYEWLLGLHNRQVVVLTGDIHRNVLPVRHSPFLYEVTSSGAAHPGLGGGLGNFGGARGNFGILTIGDIVSATLYSPDNPNGASATIRFGE